MPKGNGLGMSRRPEKEKISEHESKINLVGKDHRFEYLYEQMNESKTGMHSSLSGFFGRKNSSEYNAVTSALGDVIELTKKDFTEFAGDNLRMMRDALNAYFHLKEACEKYLEKDGGTTKSGAARKERVNMIRRLAKNDITVAQQYYHDIKFGKITEEEQAKLNWQDIIFSGRSATIEVDNLHDDKTFKALGGEMKKGEGASRKLKSGIFTKRDIKIHNGTYGLSGSFSSALNDKDIKGDYGTKTNITNRNVATSRIAGLLGLSSIIADSKTVKIKDNQTGEIFKGNMMEFAEGESADDIAQKHAKTVSDKIDDMEDKASKAQAVLAPSLQKELTSLQVLDYICGQGDRHKGNIFMQKDDSGRYAHIKGIDNDNSFATGVDFTKATQMTESSGAITNKQYMRFVVGPDGKLAIPFMDAQLAKNICNLKAEDVEFALKDLLEPQYIANTVERWKRVKKAIESEEHGWDSPRFKEDFEWTETTSNDMLQTSRHIKLKELLDKSANMSEKDRKSYARNMQFGSIGGFDTYLQNTYYGDFYASMMGLNGDNDVAKVSGSYMM